MLDKSMALFFLREGGKMRLTWKSLRREIVSVAGNAMRLDGRTYAGLIKRKDLVRRDIGAIPDLVVEWTMKVEGDEHGKLRQEHKEGVWVLEDA